MTEDGWTNAAEAIFDDEASAFANVKRERPSEPKARTRQIVKEAADVARKLTKGARTEPRKAGSKIARRSLRYSVPRQAQIFDPSAVTDSEAAYIEPT